MIKINTQTVGLGVVLSLTLATGGAYLDIRDRLTRMEAQLEILAPVAVDHMVALELEKRKRNNEENGKGSPPKSVAPPNAPVDIDQEEINRIRKEKRNIYEQKSAF